MGIKKLGKLNILNAEAADSCLFCVSSVTKLTGLLSYSQSQSRILDLNTAESGKSENVALNLLQPFL